MQYARLSQYTLSILFLALGCSAGQKSKKFVIGFSQVTVKMPWRVVFNEMLRQRAEELKDRLDLIMLDSE